MHSRETNHSISSESFDMNLKQVEQTNMILMNMENKLQNFIKKKSFIDAPNYSNLSGHNFTLNQSPRHTEIISATGSNRPKDFSPGGRSDFFQNKSSYSPPNLNREKVLTSRPTSKLPVENNYFSPSENVKSYMELDKELRHLSQRLINFDHLNEERPIRSYEKIRQKEEHEQTMRKRLEDLEKVFEKRGLKLEERNRSIRDISKDEIGISNINKVPDEVTNTRFSQLLVDNEKKPIAQVKKKKSFAKAFEKKLERDPEDGGKFLNVSSKRTSIYSEEAEEKSLKKEMSSLKRENQNLQKEIEKLNNTVRQMKEEGVFNNSARIETERSGKDQAKGGNEDSVSDFKRTLEFYRVELDNLKQQNKTISEQFSKEVERLKMEAENQRLEKESVLRELERVSGNGNGYAGPQKMRLMDGGSEKKSDFGFDFPTDIENIDFNSLNLTDFKSYIKNMRTQLNKLQQTYKSLKSHPDIRSKTIEDFRPSNSFGSKNGKASLATPSHPKTLYYENNVHYARNLKSEKRKQILRDVQRELSKSEKSAGIKEIKKREMQKVKKVEHIQREIEMLKRFVASEFKKNTSKKPFF